MEKNPYKRLAERLDALPNGFPSTPDGAELRLLAKLFTPEEASLAAELRMTPETPEQIASRLKQTRNEELDLQVLQSTLKQMARKGLIAAGRTESGLGFMIIPFVVGIYENQTGRLDEELARLFEDYYLQVFGKSLLIQPSVHRVIPIQESVRVGMEIQPFESATDIVKKAQAWAVTKCICRTQKALIGEPCKHPMENCMVLSQKPGVFDNHPILKALTCEQALDILQSAAKAGLVHSVTNTKEGLSYICNCCTCSCGILRGIAELGITNAVARSAFVNQVDEALCMGCELCLESCQFHALSMKNGTAVVDKIHCVGCGVCVPACPERALGLVRRPEEEILPIPMDENEWRIQRSTARKLDLNSVI